MDDLERYVKDEIGNPIQPLVEYVYYVVENIVPDKFDLKGIERDEEGRKLTVKNQYVPPTTNITIKKYWENDSAGQDELRPGSIEVELLRDKIVIDRQTITPSMLGNILTNNPWTFTFEDLPLTDENGYKYEYEVRESKIGDEEITNNSALDYKVSYENIYDEDGNLSEVNISNSYEGKTEVSVKKEWDDKDNQDGKRPNSVVVHLFANEKDTGKTIILSAANNWTGSFTDLPKYNNGEEINYTFTEDSIENYIMSQDCCGNITNSYTPGQTIVQVTKCQDDNNNNEVSNLNIVVNLFANGIDTGKRLVLSSTNNWTGNFTELAVSENGITINYTIKAITIRGDECITSGDPNKGYIVKNTTPPNETPKDSEDKRPKDPPGQPGERPKDPPGDPSGTPKDPAKDQGYTARAKADGPAKGSKDRTNKPPNTGDQFNIYKYLSVIGLATLGILIVRKKSKNND